LVAALAIVGCGGSDSDTSSIATVGSSTTTPPTLSQSDYIKQADAICAESNAAIAAIVPGATSGEQAVAASQEQGIIRDEISSVQSLGTPEGQSPARYLAAMQGISTQLNRKRQALQSGDDSSLTSITASLDDAEAKADAAGADYGFKKCGGTSAPSGSPVTGGGTAGGGSTPVTPTATTPTVAPPITTTTPVAPPGGGSSPVTPTTTTPTTTTPGGGVSPGGGGVGPG
jgi:hypothetical protein